MEIIQISEKEFNELSRDQISVVICHHDCDDQSVSDFSDIVSVLEDSDDAHLISGMSNMDVIDLFYSTMDLNGNNSRAIVVDNGKIKEVQWVE